MPRPSCHRKALDLLARRPHFRRELAAKLAGRRYGTGEIEVTLDELEAKRLLDDRKTARDFVESRLRREPIGRLRLLAELSRHGAPEEEARQAIDAFYPEDDLELATKAAQRWRRRSRSGAPEALARYLERRGFSRQAIVKIVKNARPN